MFAAFGNLAESGNFVVLSTVCAIIGIYAIGLVFARREDKKDELRVGKNMFADIASWREGKYWGWNQGFGQPLLEEQNH